MGDDILPECWSDDNIEMLHVCPFCSEIFNSKNLLQRHTVLHTAAGVVSEAKHEFQTFPCDLCNAELSSLAIFNRHMESHRTMPDDSRRRVLKAEKNTGKQDNHETIDTISKLRC